jgi:putative addiction module component (TIGR02574 family)
MSAILLEMSAVEIIDRLRALPPAERRLVVEKIWDEFADRDLGLTLKQAEELDRRLADHQARPDDLVSWSEIKAANEAKYRNRNP